jgi:AcrR family transcriptional regulator
VEQERPEERREALFDPYRPLPPKTSPASAGQAGPRQNQRARRARILAMTRQIIGEQGCDQVTVREIARKSGLALQTIYNLVGPRDRAILDAISEYSLFVGRMAANDQRGPSVLRNVEMWITAAEDCPDFARRCNLIILSDSRNIYYRFRDIQMRGVAKLLRQQQASGHAFYSTPPRQLAEQLVLYSMALWMEWADRPFPLPLLQEKLLAGLTKLLRD